MLEWLASRLRLDPAFHVKLKEIEANLQCLERAIGR
jgi:hypothetical protein